MELVMYLIGLLSGIVIMAIASARAYEKGERDGDLGGYVRGRYEAEQEFFIKWMKGEQ